MKDESSLPSIDEIRKRFAVAYQPIVDVYTGAVTGFEALARRIAEDGSLHSAGDVIEQIEEDPERLLALIQTVLRKVAQDLVPLFDRYSSFYVSVNIPPVVLGSGVIIDTLQELQLAPYLRRLVCEITERQALTDLGRSSLEMARDIGIRLAIDDFGTGHSGLQQIAGLDIDILKIDRSLLVPVLTNRISAKLLRGIVALAETLRIRTIAEGVETRGQAFFLQAAGVDYGQGWYWSKALPAEQVEAAIQMGFGKDGGGP
jgi:EAL domain-containing protein (putative c-di-GMP-specific phosphodiesterase class I)